MNEAFIKNPGDGYTEPEETPQQKLERLIKENPGMDPAELEGHFE